MANTYETLYSPAPAEILQTFCGRHLQEAVQLKVRRWFILALKANYDGLSPIRTTERIPFYEQLQMVLYALCRSHKEPDMVLLSLTLALEEMSQYYTPNWTLLPSPPDFSKQ